MVLIHIKSLLAIKWEYLIMPLLLLHRVKSGCMYL